MVVVLLLVVVSGGSVVVVMEKLWVRATYIELIWSRDTPQSDKFRFGSETIGQP
jgi:hypothetical protein